MKGWPYPKNAVPTNDIPELLEESLLRSPSFFCEKIPLVPLTVFTFNTVNLQEEVRGGQIYIPKIQDGFTGPGTSLIVESFLCLRKRVYAMTAAQVMSAPSWYSMAGSLSKLLLWSRVRRTEPLIGRSPEPALVTARPLRPALRQVDPLKLKLFAYIATGF